MPEALISFLAATPDPNLLYRGRYDPLLVAASFVVAVFASYVALEVSGRLCVVATRAARAGWVMLGALAMGSGIWAMHFVGMLAFSLPCGVRYDVVTTLASMVPGLLASVVALLVIGRPSVNWPQLVGGGVLLGGGIGAMHYAGMAAMRMDALLRYDPSMFIFSLVVAVILAVVALAIRFHVGDAGGAFARRKALLGALIMGGAVTGMHYTAMAAAYFIPTGAVAVSPSSLHPTLLAAVVVVISGLVIGIVLAATVAVRYFDTARRLRDANADLRQAASVFDNTAEGILIMDAHARILTANNAFAAISRYRPEELIGHTPHLLRSGRHNRAFYAAIRADLAASGYWQGEIWNRRKDGEVFPGLVTINAIHDEQHAVQKYVAIFRDITLIKRTQSQLERMAHFDALTGLPNRALLSERLSHALALARRCCDEVAVMLIDLDGFKTVNDSLGHPAGDRLLKVVATRFRETLREEDTVARLGGDEFAVILEDLKHGEDAAAVAGKLLTALAEPIDLDGHSALVTGSVGIAIFPRDGEDATALLKAADTAMYESKLAGRNTFHFHHADMAKAVRKRLEFEEGLRAALERDELEVWYQPQVDLAGGELVGAEALVRWRHPEKGLIGPHEFIALAEQTGLIVPIGERVLARACADARRWRDAWGWRGKVSVNVAGPQIERGDFHFTVLRALGTHALPAEALELEITETFIMHNAQNAFDVVDQLRKLGVTTAIDDFGTGYSSLAYLKHLPIDRLKIDRGFIRDLPQDSDDAAIVAAVIALGASLGFTVIAEGVETDEQRDFLARAGCDQGQGYLFSRPLPAAEFEAWARSRTTQAYGRCAA